MSYISALEKSGMALCDVTPKLSLRREGTQVEKEDGVSGVSVRLDILHKSK